MGVLAARSRELSVRDDGDGGESWGTMQIATPAIVGGVLLILFVVYILWRRRQPADNKQSYNYHRVKNGWTARMEQMFVPRRMRHRVLHCSAPITLDDSMPSAGLTIDFRRARQYRSDSSESQTPLTSTTYAFGYPPGPNLSESPPTPPKRHAWRWWQVFGLGPQEIKSQEPNTRWRVDDQDASSSCHGSHVHGRLPRYIIGLEAVDERQEDARVQNSVIHVGDDFTNLSTPTPMAQQFPERERMVLVHTPVPDVSTSPSARMPAMPASNTQSARGSPAPSRRSDLPPSYNISQSSSRYPSVENLVRPPRADPNMLFPPPVRAAGNGTPHMLHERQVSSESFLMTQSPMATPSMY